MSRVCELYATEDLKMKLASVLFSGPWRAYQVSGDSWDRPEDFARWELHPLAAPTLAAEDVEGAFQGLFIIAAQLVTSVAKPHLRHHQLHL